MQQPGSTPRLIVHAARPLSGLLSAEPGLSAAGPSSLRAARDCPSSAKQPLSQMKVSRTGEQDKPPEQELNTRNFFLKPKTVQKAVLNGLKPF